jgi:hypothetical protein
MEMMWQSMMQQQQQQNALMHQQQQQILLMERLLGNNTNNDSSSDECVDSDSSSDIGYETDLTEVNDLTEDNADMDAAEDNDGDEDYDISDFADNEHSLEYPTMFPSGEAVLLPRAIDNGVDRATMETDNKEEISTTTPNTFLPPTTFPTTTNDKVDHTDHQSGAEKGYKLAAVMGKIALETIGTLNSYKEALASKHSEHWKGAMAKGIGEIEETGCWHLVHQSDLPKGMRPIPGRWTVMSLN